MSQPVNLGKIDRMAALALANAIRLHEDAILLFDNGSYPSAYALSVLSLEEIGKYYQLDDFTWHSRIEGRFLPEEEEQWLGQAYQHRAKQSMFASVMRLPGFAKRAFREMCDGKLEKKKQDAIYVGLRRVGRKVDTRGRINVPSKVSEGAAAKQITCVNDFLVVWAGGVLGGCYAVEQTESEGLLTAQLVARLRQKWPTMSAAAQSVYRRLAPREGKAKSRGHDT